MTQSSSSSEDPKQKIAMGYPSMDRYNQVQHMFPSQPPSTVYPVPGGHQGYLSSRNLDNVSPPYASTSSYHFPLGYHDPTASPYQPNPKYLTPDSDKPYAQQPYNDDFYYPQQNYKPLVPNTNHRSSFERAMLILMVVLVSCMCMMTLVMWFMFGTYIPEFEAASLKVSNFTVTNTTLTGEWDVDIYISNTNTDLAISFDQVTSSIFYKESMLGMSAVKGFRVPQMQRTHVNISLVAEQSSDENKLQSWVLPTLAHDHSNGMVAFNLKLSVKANYTTSRMVYRKENMVVFCDNMQVMFSVGTGEGKLSPGLENTCLIRVNEGIEEY